MSFNSLGLAPQILKAILEKGYSEPTPIQQQAIPAILEGGDILGAAQTGTGKTAAFTLPLLHRMSILPAKTPAVRTLILTPTRELASQVGENLATYGKYLPFKSLIIFGGVNINTQMEKLRRGADIVIATPGRLLDHVRQRTIDLSKVEFLILDEADRMLDMGFIRDIQKILKLLPLKRQNLLFSATFSEDIKTLAQSFLHEPKMIQATKSNSTTALVSQVIHPVDSKRKKELLSFLINSQKWSQVLVFTRTKHGANRLSEQLSLDGIRSAAIHGNKSQGARTRALDDFKRGSIRVLVATDIAARGLDIDQLPHVVNFDLPNVAEDYVHRIGRTGRAGNDGAAISLVCIDEHKHLRDIERLIKCEIPKVQIPGFEPNPAIKAQEIPNGRNGRNGRSSRPMQGRNGRSSGRYTGRNR